jgi:hypothetical protein
MQKKSDLKFAEIWLPLKNITETDIIIVRWHQIFLTISASHSTRWNRSFFSDRRFLRQDTSISRFPSLSGVGGNIIDFTVQRTEFGIGKLVSRILTDLFLFSWIQRRFFQFPNISFSITGIIEKQPPFMVEILCQICKRNETLPRQMIF